jgi:hypothetical protein
MGGIGEAFKDFGLGAIAGLAFVLASKLFGGLGIIAAPLLVGSMMKGSERGKIIALIAGFMLIAAGGIASSSSSNSGTNTSVM